MGTRPAGERDKNLLQVLRSEFGSNPEGWLSTHGARMLLDAVRSALLAYSDIAAARGGQPQPVDDAARGGLRRSRQRHEDEWLRRHVLDPASPGCLLPKDWAEAVRARFLAKLRDRARIARGSVLTVRVSDETALGLDEIGRRLFGCTSRSETVKSMGWVATTHLRSSDGKRDGSGAG